MIPSAQPRPFIALRDGKILHNGNPTRVVFTPDVIEVGCSIITREAAEFIHREYNAYLARPAEKVLQE